MSLNNYYLCCIKYALCNEFILRFILRLLRYIILQFNVLVNPSAFGHIEITHFHPVLELLFYEFGFYNSDL